MTFRLARDGHLLDVDIDALIRDDLDRSLREQVESHAADCIDCRRRLDRGREDYRAPLPARAAPTPEPPRPPAPPRAARPAAAVRASPAPPVSEAAPELPPTPVAAPPAPLAADPEPSAPINLDVDSARRRQRWEAPKAPSEPARGRTREA